MSSCHGCHHIYPASTYQELVSHFKVFHTKEVPGKSYWTEGDKDFIQISDKVVLELPSVSKAIQSWESFKTSCERRKMGVMLVGVLGCAWGTWRAIEKLSAPWAIGTALFGCVAYFWRSHLNNDIDQSTLAKMELNTMIDEQGKPVSVEGFFRTFRESILREGLEKYEECSKPIPPAYPKELLTLFNAEELKDLFKRWGATISQLPSEEKVKLAAEHDLFEKGFASSSEQRKVAVTYNRFKVECTKESVEPAITRSVDTTVRKMLLDLPHSEECYFRRLFYARWQVGFKEFTFTDELHRKGKEACFFECIKLLKGEIEKVNLWQVYRDEIGTLNFQNVFAQIFRAEGVDDYRGYIAWVRALFERLPDDYANKQTLLSLVPEN